MKAYLRPRFSLAALLILLTIMAPVSWWLARRWNEPEPTVVIELNSESELLVDKQAVSREELAKWVAEQISRRKRYGMETHLHIRANRAARASDVLAVFSVLEEVGGVDKVSIYNAVQD